MSKKKSGSQFGVANVELEIPIDAPSQKVWNALVKQTSKWWPEGFATKADARIIIEPKLGGRWYEHWGKSAGLVWYDVIGIDPPRSILLRGQLSAKFGGPAMTMLEIKLEANKKRTTLHLSDHTWGNVSPKMRDSLEEGWKQLMEVALKQFVEK